MNRSKRIHNNPLLIKLFVICSLISSGLSAQQTKFILEGRVVDKQSGEPIPLVNVYLAQTTLGSATDTNGNFKIYDVPGAMFSLVASAIGYEPHIVNEDLRKGINKFINIRLSPKIYELGEVDIQAKADDDWKKQLELFKKLFFGENDFAKYCEIKNPYHINFNEEDFVFTANASSPIFIRNNAFGYEIECVLKFFQYDKRKRTLAFSIFPKFSEIVSADKDSMKLFQNNRKSAFLGSSVHLLSALAAGRFKYRDEGFELKLESNPVGKAEEIVTRDITSNRYYLNYNGCILIDYWFGGIRKLSKLCLVFGSTEFSSDGYLMYPGEFEMSGAMAKEGVATLLPRFLETARGNN